MFYAKLKDGNVELYPYTITDLRRAYPNVSFPPEMSDEELAQFDVVQVTPTEQPVIDYTKNLSRWAEKQGAVWVEVWTITDATPEEISQRLSDQWEAVRQERDAKLYQCDWTQLPDAPVDHATWATYRQQLREVTQQSDPFNIVWPVAPQA